MFTGIVEELGEVRELFGSRLVVGCNVVTEGTDVGASVAVSGVCLTVVENTGDSLAFDLSEETLSRSALGLLQPGGAVNLERPVTLTARLGGHLVQGHVDGVGTVVGVERTADGGSDVTFDAPEELSRYMVEKGSVTVDGVSLTIAALDGKRITVALIPHTMDVTTLGRAAPGQPLNLEVDVIAKYVEKMLGDAHGGS
jgi:riboflavin synthase